ncbi:MAG: right-handed parallel beta-helix repeat-containing protein [Thermoplasmatales archaeon]|nr:MAG: right-handed parallel beta-helix repeat-containing protein [Thermoplasmatales archaeon]
MKRRSKVAILLLITFISIETALSASANIQEDEYTLIVDKTEGGTYTTIQEAINDAPEGSTIYVKNGAYSEIIDIRKKISIIGENKDKTIINPISEKNKYAVRLGAPGVKISCLSITNGAPGLYTNGIRISASETKIYNCNIYDTPVGIAIWTSYNIIQNCNFWGCSDEGIALMGSPYSKCDNNRITNCLFFDNCDGIELQYSSDNIIEDCEFYENTHAGIDAIASSNDRNMISNCKIYNNEVHGIYFSSSSENQIIDCLISDNKDGDIIMNENSRYNEIKYNSEDLENEKENDEQEYYLLENYKNIISKFFNRLSKINIKEMIPFFAL